MVNFQVLADSAHQAKLERHQSKFKLDVQYPHHSALGRLTYDLSDKNGKPNIGIINPSNCKADTINKDYQEIVFFDCKIQLVKVQLTHDLSDDTILFEGICLPCKTIQDIFTSRTQTLHT